MSFFFARTFIGTYSFLIFGTIATLFLKLKNKNYKHFLFKKNNIFFKIHSSALYCSIFLHHIYLDLKYLKNILIIKNIKKS